MAVVSRCFGPVVGFQLMQTCMTCLGFAIQHVVQQGLNLQNVSSHSDENPGKICVQIYHGLCDR